MADEVIDKTDFYFSNYMDFFDDKKVDIYEQSLDIYEEVKIYDISNDYDISNLTDIYLDFLVKENSFYTSLITNNVKEINRSEVLDISNFEYMKFLNIDMVIILDELYYEYNRNNILSNIDSISNLDYILNEVLEIKEHVDSKNKNKLNSLSKENNG